MTSTSSRTHRSPLSYKIPAADQDVDDLTLGEMLTEAYRGQVDYSVREGVSVSQSSSSLTDRTGQPVGDRSGQPGAFGTHMVYRETFLQIHLHLHQLLILKN